VSRSQLGLPALVAIVASAALVVLAVGWFAVVAPQRHRAESAAHAVEQAQTQIRAVQQSERQAVPTPEKQPVIRTADLYRIVKAMPSTQDQPDLLLELDQVARASGVTVLTITPRGATAANGYTTVPIDLTLTGDYYALTDLLYRLRALVAVRHGALDATGRLFSVESLTLTPVGSGKTLNAALTVDAFVYGTVPGASASTTTTTTTTQSTTTSTSTTSTDSTTSTAGTTAGSGG
jgi:Tfp pilus assembly protein PilO